MIKLSSCGDFKISLCPQCRIERYDLCWLVEYKDLMLYMRPKNIRDFYLEMRTKKAYVWEELDLPVSYWIEAAIRIYHPQHQGTIDKIKILL